MKLFYSAVVSVAAGVIGAAAGACILITGCNRSSAYRADQDYYREDSDYAARKNSAIARAEHFGQPKKRICVLPFFNVTPLGGEDLGEFSADELSREIKASGRAIVPEDLRLGDASKEFYSGDKVRLGALVREGKRLGVTIVVIGKIKKITYRAQGDEVGLFRQKRSIAAVDLEMRMFDVPNSKEIIFDEKSSDSQSSQMNIFGTDDSDTRSQRLELVKMALRNGMRAFAQDAVRALEKIGWEGRILKITTNRVYVNAGRASGLSIGDILRVLTPGENIYDHSSGAYVGKSTGQTKGTLEVVNYLGADGAETKVHSGGNFSEDDVVQLY